MTSSETLQESPQINAGFFSDLFFCWLTPLFLKGRKETLQTNDLYATIPSDKSSPLGDILETAWTKELENSEGPSLFKVLVRVFGLKYLKLAALVAVGELVFQIAQPVLLGRLIRSFETPVGSPSPTPEPPWALMLGLLVAAFLYQLTHHRYFYLAQCLGMHIRVACSSLIYRQALKMRGSGKSSFGQVLNLLANDVNRFDLVLIYLHFVWIAPIQLAIVIYFLWGHFDFYCLTGVSVLILFVPIQAIMGKLFGIRRAKTAIKTDKRVRVINEVISGIGIIKMQVWEKLFADKVTSARKYENVIVIEALFLKFPALHAFALCLLPLLLRSVDEIGQIRKTAYLRAVNLTLHDISSKLTIFITLLVYVLTGNHITSEKVFVAIAFYNSVRRVFTYCAPLGICNWAETKISIQRIQDYLLNVVGSSAFDSSPICNDLLVQSHEGKCQEWIQKVNVDNSTSNALMFNSFSGSWDGHHSVLSKINLQIEKGELIAIVGKTGAGKTSLLQSILGELKRQLGSVQVNGEVSYAPQESWLVEGTIRDNILFGSKFDSSRYFRVIEACTLKPDFTSLPEHDHTLVGDTKANCLSGGQKARINLARAVYANSEIVLLDDPFSAVDASVANHIFSSCILSLLQRDMKRTVIIVTHQTQFLPSMPKILLLDQGKMTFFGPYAEFMKAGVTFEQAEDSSRKLENLCTNSPKMIRSSPKSGTGSFKKHDKKLKISRTFSAPAPIKRRIRRVLSSTSEVNLEGWVEEFPEVEESEDNFKCLHENGQEDYDQSSQSSESKIPTELLEAPTSRSRTAYWKYFKAGSGIAGILFLALLTTITQFLYTGSDYWLQIWVTSEQKYANFTDPAISEKELHPQRNLDIAVYVAIFILLSLFALMKTFFFFRICMKASVSLHKRLFQAILFAPMNFFISNSTGKILNVFVKDVGIVDDLAPTTIFETVTAATNVMGVLVVVSIMNPILLIPSTLLVVLFFFVRALYINTAKNIKRLEALTKSPVFSHTSQTLRGLAVIRAFKTEPDFRQEFDKAQDVHTAAWVLVLAGSRWLASIVEIISLAFIGCVAFSFILFAQGGSSVGLAISSAMTLSAMFQWGVRQSAETESQLVSVERISAFSNISSEVTSATDSSSKDRQAATIVVNEKQNDWPSKGHILFDKLTVSFIKKSENSQQTEEKIVLDKLSFEIQPGHKIGVVGRTGAGKSTLVSALFRLVRATSGRLLIDGIDITELSLEELRSKLSIIPQEPMLLQGCSIRENLDPHGKNEDSDIWESLRKISMDDVVKDFSQALDTQVTEGTFSIGQKQLLCLGRSLLQRNNILVLDEATAALDKKTDELIQKTISTNFSHCTTITIAHRLDTVAQSDKILVLDDGKLIEYEAPAVLLANRKSHFWKMVEESTKSKKTAPI